MIWSSRYRFKPADLLKMLTEDPLPLIPGNFCINLWYTDSLFSVI